MALFELCGVKNTRDAFNNVNPFSEMKLDAMDELKQHSRQLDIDQAFIRAPIVNLVRFLRRFDDHFLSSLLYSCIVFLPLS
jgi:hypothetical protein